GGWCLMGIADGKVVATVAVSSFEIAREFYGGTLGLKQAEENVGGVGYECGGGNIFVYVSDTAGSGEATAATWQVDDVTPIAEELSGKGVKFEHYEMPDAELVGDVHQWGDGAFKMGWFRDPDGNILGIVSGDM
ncbi:MAG: VOC family protein, partial [Solirubrobacterales bacterium]